MTDVTEAPQAEPAPVAPRRPRWLPWALGAGAGVLAIAVTATVTAVLVGRDDPADKPPAAATFEVFGSIRLTDYSGYRKLADQSCYGKGGYDDIAEGAQVVISADGKTLALGQLDEGLAASSGGCRLTFRVKGIPAGLPFYTVEVTHRGGVQYTETQMREPLELTLG